MAGAANVSRRDRVVLAALVVRAGHPVRTEELVDALWGEHPPPSSHKILQGCIVRLRKVLGADAIETSARGYVLTLPRTSWTPTASNDSSYVPGSWSSSVSPTARPTS